MPWKAKRGSRKGFCLLWAPGSGWYQRGSVHLTLAKSLSRGLWFGATSRGFARLFLGTILRCGGKRGEEKISILWMLGRKRAWAILTKEVVGHAFNGGQTPGDSEHAKKFKVGGPGAYKSLSLAPGTICVTGKTEGRVGARFWPIKT